MGHQFGAICSACGRGFTVNVGGGFTFELLHCDKCGRTHSVGHAEVLDAYQGYQRTPLAEQEYYQALEKHAGRCSCGGQFLLSARPRCPRCGSTGYQEDPESPSILYD